MIFIKVPAFVSMFAYFASLWIWFWVILLMAWFIAYVSLFCDVNISIMIIYINYYYTLFVYFVLNDPNLFIISALWYIKKKKKMSRSMSKTNSNI